VSIDQQAIREPKPLTPGPERTLILGWNRRGSTIARELSRYVAPDSLLTIAADTPDVEQEIAALSLPSANLRLEFRRADITSRTALESLGVPEYDHVLVLGYSDLLPAQPADTRTLVCLLHLRKIADDVGKHIGVVSEMIDVRNRELAEVTRADDFVVSNKLVSLMLAQASENEYLSAIFDDLLDEKGSEFYMRPASDYVAIDRPVTFYTVAEAARRRGEVAIGYRRAPKADAVKRGLGGVVVNPVKSELLTYEPTDRIIVLARD
jgi:voltage-gated potassium channel Kch